MAGEIEFEWDQRKSESNKRKHGLTFDEAIGVFRDPLQHLEIRGNEHGEIRWHTTGEISGILCVVVHAIQEEGQIEIYRIISARKATPRESKIYEEGA